MYFWEISLKDLDHIEYIRKHVIYNQIVNNQGFILFFVVVKGHLFLCHQEPPAKDAAPEKKDATAVMYGATAFANSIGVTFLLSS